MLSGGFSKLLKLLKAMKHARENANSRSRDARACGARACGARTYEATRFNMMTRLATQVELKKALKA